MQELLSALTYLRLSSRERDQTALVLPDSFFGGSAPRLQSSTLPGIPFFALSASHLLWPMDGRGDGSERYYEWEP
jgi:hypothetical protein